MAVLVIAEHDHSTIKDATLSTVTAAAKLGGPVTVLVAGHACDQAASAAATIAGVEKVLKADHELFQHFIAEHLTALCLKVVSDGGYTAVLAPGTTFGKNILPRLSALMDVQQITDVIAIEGPDTFKRPIYGGQAVATVQTDEPVKILTVRATAFDKAQTGVSPAAIESISFNPESAPAARFEGQELSKSERPELTSASIVVSGGRGVGSADNFAMIEALADKLGAAVGASRAAVDAGYISNDHQVGQTGKAVAPDLYIAVGISGAIQHLAGMKDSKVIVAINKDADAPIFQVADYGLVDDLFTAVPALTESL